MKQSTKNEAPAASRKQAVIAALAVAAVVCHLVMRYAVGVAGAVLGLPLFDLPLVLALAFGGGPLVLVLLVKLWRREFGSDLLAGASIVTSVLLGEYLAGTLVVLMLSGGEALEAYAVRSASSVLAALANACLPPHTASGTGKSPTCRSTPSRSATLYWSSRMKSARWTAPWSRATARWTSRT